ncbi:hypothetical protein GCM10010441_72400 [Kitasatospora paracochleata]|uniref:Uncharacterized protein n=1 Tax=Kitasatospora paracochleata TaxID=58354 RepID=A0ABT1J954_9ACTN|nr:hypothetical protein [Kitasatospora paracochleata]MCP2313980.1 hypothetical protein [Kitasatospora paracochleata]
MDKVSARFAQLQKDVGQRQASAAALAPGAAGRAEAFAELQAAADALLAYAARVPDLRQEPARRATEQFVMWTRRGAAAAAALTAAGVIPGWVAWGWLILLLPLTLAALSAGWQATPLAKHRPHLRHRVSATLLAASTLLLSAVAFGAVSAWWVIASLAAAAATLATGLPDDPKESSK